MLELHDGLIQSDVDGYMPVEVALTLVYLERAHREQERLISTALAGTTASQRPLPAEAVPLSSVHLHRHRRHHRCYSARAVATRLACKFQPFHSHSTLLRTYGGSTLWMLPCPKSHLNFG